jgi:TetR/AcrR family transcriptional repressor of nem operon
MITIIIGMKVDRKTLARHRAAMLEQAGKLFRVRGFGAVGVADITQAAGLTHGAFYGHFASKSALAAESCRAALLASAAQWRRRAADAMEAGLDPLGALIDRYLAPSHRDAPDDGCAIATLGPEAARDPALRAALADGTNALLEVLREVLEATRPHITPEARPGIALAVLSAMNGGLILARMLADQPAASDAALAAAAAAARRAAA